MIIICMTGHQRVITDCMNSYLNDYVYMRTNNVIISNNQSKDLIALWCLHVKSKALHSRLHAISIILIIR